MILTIDMPAWLAALTLIIIALCVYRAMTPADISITTDNTDDNR